MIRSKPVTATLADLLPATAIESFLDAHGLGSGASVITRIGEGGSNLTFRVVRHGMRLVARRPPPPPLPPSAHDVVREAFVLKGVARAGLPVPTVIAVCEDASLIGVPFFLMEEVDGVVISSTLPSALDSPQERRRIAFATVDALAEIHAIDVEAAGLASIGKPTGFLERQLRRWADLWNLNATRDLPAFGAVALELRRRMPASPRATIVHGDYRLGNLIFRSDAPARIAAILDWEMATIGDPLADLGYLLATWAQAGDEAHPMLLSRATAAHGFPTREQIAARYVERSGADLTNLRWYRALALWKAAVFCEAIYGRYLRGERTDEVAKSFGPGVPHLVRAAAADLEMDVK
jgi:aminoglycoside phosphotransferase (APT) family kinase protein